MPQADGGSSHDPREFRNALGKFPTGVTIVTTRSPDDLPVGVTVSSFNAVSLDPPLVLWSLQLSSISKEFFDEFGRFTVNVLADDQSPISNQFASDMEDKFDGVDWHWGDNETPVIDNVAAAFECETYAAYDGGDHVIYVGRVTHFMQSDSAPLVFCNGQYRVTAPLEV